jgi:hypothetical protein
LADPGGDGGIAKDGHARNIRRELLEQFQPFPAHAVFEHEEAGDVAARPRQARHETSADRVDNECEHDRHGARRLQQGRHGRASTGSQDEVRRKSGQFGCVFAKLLGIGGGPADVDPHITALGPTQLRQCLSKHHYPGLKFRIVLGCCDKQANGSHPVRMLGASGKRPRDRGPTQCTEKLAPPHVGLRSRGRHLSGSFACFDSGRNFLRYCNTARGAESSTVL